MDKIPRKGKTLLIARAIATLGPIWALRRAKCAFLKQSGILEQRTPLYQWDELRWANILNSSVPTDGDKYIEWRHNHTPSSLLPHSFAERQRETIGPESVRIADAILNGTFPFFSSKREMGFPPAWHTDPKTGRGLQEGHWSKIDEFAAGDIKFQWELSRFSWVFPLARAFVRARNPQYAEAFWVLTENWMEENPPNWGVNWMCGQEAAFRAIALCFAYSVFRDAPASSSVRVIRLVTLLHTLGVRIHSFIEYALSQKNNHGISEATGLWTIGSWFPELRAARPWRDLARRLIEREVRRQVYADGSYIQHSTNYHRVMLHIITWALRIGECTGEILASSIYEQLSRAERLFSSLVDPSTGWAPNYGANDGALILPLSDCEYPDMRPALQSCHYLLRKERLYPPGPWDEEMMWLNGTESLQAVQPAYANEASDLIADVGGYYTLHSKDSWLMMRAVEYVDRPSHADQLHIDMWWRGVNVLCDAGTYSYNARPPFDHGFASSRFHNTVTVDGADQMTMISRFLWGNWADSKVTRGTTGPAGWPSVQGEHNGYLRFGVLHRRAVFQLDQDVWTVVDDILGVGLHRARLHWLVTAAPLQEYSPGDIELRLTPGIMRLMIRSSEPTAFDLIRAGERASGHSKDPPALDAGWLSRWYGHKVPAISYSCESHSQLPLRFVTVVSLGVDESAQIDSLCSTISIGRRRARLTPIGDSPVRIEIEQSC